MPGMATMLLGVFLMLIMSAFAGGIHVEFFHVVREFHIRFNELAPLGNTFILVLVGGRGPLVAFLYACGNVIGNQLYQCIS